MDKDNGKRSENVFEIDDIADDGVYCVALTEEDIKAFREYAKKHRQEGKKKQ